MTNWRHALIVLGFVAAGCNPFQPDHRLTVRVVDTSNRPLVGAEVLIETQDDRGLFATPASGEVGMTVGAGLSIRVSVTLWGFDEVRARTLAPITTDSTVVVALVPHG